MDKEELNKYCEDLVQERDPRETKEWYSKWAKDYDNDAQTLDYNGKDLAVNGFLELGLAKDSRILDIGAGTGNAGEALKKNGFTNMDALEPSSEMLEIAKQKNCYKNIFNCFVTKEERLPIDDKVYDAVILVGCLCPGHIKWNSFPQIIRVVKPGGVIFWIIGHNWEGRNEEFRDGNKEKLVQSLCDQGKWQFLPGFPKRVENYMSGSDGTLYAMKVL